MDQLTTLDAGFLKAEDADRHVSLAIGGLAVIEGPIPERDALMATLAQRVRACPRFGQRLRTRPFDLGAPEWVDDPDFDLTRMYGTSHYRGPATTESCSTSLPT